MVRYSLLLSPIASDKQKKLTDCFLGFRHCKHYCGRGLMKRFENGEELAKEMGIKPEVLKKTCPFPSCIWARELR